LPLLTKAKEARKRTTKVTHKVFIIAWPLPPRKRSARRPTRSTGRKALNCFYFASSTTTATTRRRPKAPLVTRQRRCRLPTRWRRCKRSSCCPPPSPSSCPRRPRGPEGASRDPQLNHCGDFFLQERVMQSLHPLLLLLLLPAEGDDDGGDLQHLDLESAQRFSPRFLPTIFHPHISSSPIIVYITIFLNLSCPNQRPKLFSLLYEQKNRPIIFSSTFIRTVLCKKKKSVKDQMIKQEWKEE
jgi:hypothetical protein